MGESKLKQSLYVFNITDILKAHYLGMSMGTYLARIDELGRQVEEVKRGGKSTT